MIENYASEYFYDKQGCKISEEQWQELSQDKRYYLIGHDSLDDYEIHTIWMGTDMAEFDDPVIFRTLVWRNDFSMIFLYYASEKVAKKHHNMLTFMADQKCLEQFLKERIL